MIKTLFTLALAGVVFMSLAGCASGRSAATKDMSRNAAYQLGQSDAVKRQYWIARNLQMGKRNSDENPYTTRYYTFNIQPDPQADINRVAYNITLPILE